MARRKDHLQRAVRIESLPFDFVVRPGQTAYRISNDVVLEDFGEADFVLQQRTAERHARRRSRNANKVVVFPAQTDVQVAHAESPTFGWWYGFHLCERA